MRTRLLSRAVDFNRIERSEWLATLNVFPKAEGDDASPCSFGKSGVQSMAFIPHYTVGFKSKALQGFRRLPASVVSVASFKTLKKCFERSGNEVFPELAVVDKETDWRLVCRAEHNARSPSTAAPFLH